MDNGLWNVLIVDDEPPIRSELRYLLSRDARIGAIDEAGNGTEAVEKLLAGRPDVLFLDIQMPGTSGIKLAETLAGLKTPPAVVFVTAFAEYAAEAFELDAVDYVLKPVEEARLTRALDKVGSLLAAKRAAAPAARVRRLAVERAGNHAFIPVGDICYIEANADYANVICPGGTYLANESISSLEQCLEAEGFLRVHRSFLVNLDEVHDVEISRGGAMELRCTRIDAVVPVSRRRAALVKERLGLV